MKTLAKLILPICAIFLCANFALAEGAKNPEELASKAKQAIADKDSKTLSGLYNWEGVAPDIEKQLKESITMMLEEPARKAEVRPIPKDFQAVQEMGGKSYKQNLDVKGVIALVYSPEDDSAIATMPYGEKSGKYFFTAPVIK